MSVSKSVRDLLDDRAQLERRTTAVGDAEEVGGETEQRPGQARHRHPEQAQAARCTAAFTAADATVNSPALCNTA